MYKCSRILHSIERDSQGSSLLQDVLHTANHVLYSIPNEPIRHPVQEGVCKVENKVQEQEEEVISQKQVLGITTISNDLQWINSYNSLKTLRKAFPISYRRMAGRQLQLGNISFGYIHLPIQFVLFHPVLVVDQCRLHHL